MKKKAKIVVIVLAIILVIMIVAIVTFLLVDFLLRKSSVEVSKNNSTEQYNENDTIIITPQPVTEEEMKKMEEREKKREADRQASKEEWEQMSFDKISMSIKEGSVTKNGATLIITNNNELSCGHGDNYRIQRKILGLWIPIIPIVMPWSVADSECGIILSKTSVTPMRDWSKIYGTLRSGKYRLREEIYINGKKQYIYAEFSI